MSCHGCCHEAAEPCRLNEGHFPSGEMSCMLCIRNLTHVHFKKKLLIDNFLLMKNYIKLINRKRVWQELDTREKVEFT